MPFISLFLQRVLSSNALFSWEFPSRPRSSSRTFPNRCITSSFCWSSGPSNWTSSAAFRSAPKLRFCAISPPNIWCSAPPSARSSASPRRTLYGWPTTAASRATLQKFRMSSGILMFCTHHSMRCANFSRDNRAALWKN